MKKQNYSPKTNIEIVKELELNTCIWQDCLEAVHLLSSKSFITGKQKISTTWKIDRFYSRKQRAIEAGRF